MTTATAKPRLRVAHVTQGLEVGGLERLLVEMARNADRARFDWTVVVLGPRGAFADALEAEGVRVVPFEMPTGLRPRLLRRLVHMFRAEHYEIVHTHDDRPLIYGALAAWWAGVPRRVHTHHHGRLASITGRQRFLIRQASRFTEHFVCVSDDSARFMIEQGIDARKVKTIHNGIDLSRFVFQGPADDGPIVTVARLSPEKDIANLLRAAHKVVVSFPNARFEIAGDGPCRAELEHLAKELCLTDYVVFHGQVRDVPALLAHARVFVLPSQTEGISLTVLEAQARGLPVVATAVGGTPEVVAPGVTGLLIPARDPESLAKAITTLLDDPELGRTMGRAGRQRVETCFDIRTMTAAYETLYESA